MQSQQLQIVKNREQLTAERLVVTGRHQLVINAIDLPELSSRQVLLRGLLSGISHATEMAVYTQSTPSFGKIWDSRHRLFTKNAPVKKLTSKLGYEFVGVVESIGVGVHELALGDLVWMDAHHQNRHILDLDTDAYVPLPRAIDPSCAAFLAHTRVALNGVHDAQPKIGDVAFVSGLGSIGLLVVRLLKIAGVSTIHASDPIALRRDRALSSGAIVWNPIAEDVGAMVKAVTPNGVDFAIECSGTYGGLRDATRACGVGGRIVMVGTCRESISGLVLGEEWHKNRLEMVASMSVNGCSHRNHPMWSLARLNAAALELLVQGTVKVADLVTDRYHFHDAAAAFSAIQNAPEEIINMLLIY